jgi:glycosyltransferase involved in cell wall biosynthesis
MNPPSEEQHSNEYMRQKQPINGGTRTLTDRPLKVCLISYRSNPHSGGQGVYLNNLSRALSRLGHRVEVISGPPSELQLEGNIPIHRPLCLDLYHPDHLFRVPTLKELTNPINLVEWLGVSTMGFPEPFTFGIRAYLFLQNRLKRYDVVHDNQSLSYGIWAIQRKIPTVATIHHPITVDRDLAVRSVKPYWKKIKYLRWFSFIRMQKIVSRTFSHILTVSRSAQKDIEREFRIPAEKFRIVPNGIDTDLFYPLPEIEREKNRLIVTNSADIPLKGLFYLLHALAALCTKRKLKLIVIGSPKKNGGIEKLIEKLGIAESITFTGRISHTEFVRQYARAAIAVIPSLYEGFGIPAGEAMACGIPVISTTGGALPEVVGDAGLLVPPADPQALAHAIEELLDHPAFAFELGQKGYRRIQRHFTWQTAAEKTAAAYREAIHDYHRF